MHIPSCIRIGSGGLPLILIYQIYIDIVFLRVFRIYLQSSRFVNFHLRTRLEHRALRDLHSSVQNMDLHRCSNRKVIIDRFHSITADIDS